jgi:hypothetical protein
MEEKEELQMNDAPWSARSTVKRESLNCSSQIVPPQFEASRSARWVRVCTLDQDIKSLSMYKDFIVNIGKLLIDEPISKSVFPRCRISTA